MRRTASFSNIQIQEAADEDEEEEKSSPHNSAKKSQDPASQFSKLKTKQVERLAKQATHGYQGMNMAAKSYFEYGSVRNTAHDEDFFHCFVQYLDEAIKKLKEQGGDPSCSDSNFD